MLNDGATVDPKAIVDGAKGLNGCRAHAQSPDNNLSMLVQKRPIGSASRRTGRPRPKASHVSPSLHSQTSLYSDYALTRSRDDRQQNPRQRRTWQGYTNVQERPMG